MPAVRARAVALALALGSLAVQGAQAQSVVPTSRVRHADSLTAPRVGDRVTIAGRITLGGGILDTAGVQIYVQDSSGGVRVHAGAADAFLSPVTGDSVAVSGVIAHVSEQGQLVDARIVVFPAEMRTPPPRRISAFLPSELLPARAGLVVVEGVVSRSYMGTGDHVLILEDTVAEGSYVTVVADENGGATLDLGRFSAGDRVRVTGILERRASRRTGIMRFSVYPRDADDLSAVGLTVRSRRRVALFGGGPLAIVAGVLALQYRARRRRATLGEADRLRAEMAHRYRVLVEQARVGIVVLRGGAIVYANAAFGMLVGESVTARLHGRPFRELVYQDVVARKSNDSGDALNDAAASRMQLERADRGIVDVEVVEGDVVYEGEPCVQLLVHDVSGRARAERALAEKEAQLRQAQKLEAIGLLAGGVAHDFNNILTAIKGNACLMMTGCEQCGRVAEEIAEIDRAADRAAGLTRQLLAFSRKHETEPQVIELDAVVRGLEGMLQRLVPENVTQRVVLSASRSQVLADPGSIEQIIVNLAVNARDAMPNGGTLAIRTGNVVVDAGAETEAGGTAVPPGRYLCLSVTDTGVGMDETVRRRAFEPFFTTKEPGKGTGLGLSTVYGIVKQSEGYIFLNGLPGMGTTVKIFLPRVDGITELPQRHKPSLVEAARGTETVLIVDDEPAIRRIAARTLERHGYAVLLAENGMGALTLARTHVGTIHLLLTDVIMPGLSGPELAQHLRRMRGKIKVLYMSGYTDDLVQRHGLDESGSELLQKPFTPQELLDRIRLIVGAKAAVVA